VVVAPSKVTAPPGKDKPMEKLGEPTKEKPANAATVLVKAPMDVRVKFNGQLANRTTEEQTFVTPALEPGQNYSYQVTAEAERDGKPVTRTKKVMVKANEQARVDFSDLTVPVGTGAARVTVVAPAGAKVYVDNVAINVNGTRTTFETPALTAGRSYFYIIKAEVEREGRPQTESQRVVVQAGKEVTVEFKKLTPNLTVSR
jgi:uncharacterized protein (TIGR03000 family)